VAVAAAGQAAARERWVVARAAAGPWAAAGMVATTSAIRLAAVVAAAGQALARA